MSEIKRLMVEAIAIFGSEDKLAEATGMSQSRINEAKHGGQVGPRLAMAIDRATKGKVSKSALRPDLWPPRGGKNK